MVSVRGAQTSRGVMHYFGCTDSSQTAMMGHSAVITGELIQHIKVSLQVLRSSAEKRKKKVGAFCGSIERCEKKRLKWSVISHWRHGAEVWKWKSETEMRLPDLCRRSLTSLRWYFNTRPNLQLNSRRVKGSAGITGVRLLKEGGIKRTLSVVSLHWALSLSVTLTKCKIGGGVCLHLSAVLRDDHFPVLYGGDCLITLLYNFPADVRVYTAQPLICASGISLPCPHVSFLPPLQPLTDLVSRLLRPPTGIAVCWALLRGK